MRKIIIKHICNSSVSSDFQWKFSNNYIHKRCVSCNVAWNCWIRFDDLYCPCAANYSKDFSPQRINAKNNFSRFPNLAIYSFGEHCNFGSSVVKFDEAKMKFLVAIIIVLLAFISVTDGQSTKPHQTPLSPGSIPGVDDPPIILNNGNVPHNL